MAYREKIAPTRDGFQELWDSFQEPTIEMLMAGIQSRKTTAEQLLKITGEMRSSHTLLDKELYRLGTLSRDYNEKWAPKKTYQYGVTEDDVQRFLQIMKQERDTFNKRKGDIENWVLAIQIMLGLITVPIIVICIYIAFRINNSGVFYL